MTYKHAKLKLEKCREEIKRLSRKIEAQEVELEGLVKLCELLGRYENPELPTLFKAVVEQANDSDTSKTDWLETNATPVTCPESVDGVPHFLTAKDSTETETPVLDFWVG